MTVAFCELNVYQVLAPAKDGGQGQNYTQRTKENGKNSESQHSNFL